MSRANPLPPAFVVVASLCRLCFFTGSPREWALNHPPSWMNGTTYLTHPNGSTLSSLNGPSLMFLPHLPEGLSLSIDTLHTALHHLSVGSPLYLLSYPVTSPPGCRYPIQSTYWSFLPSWVSVTGHLAVGCDSSICSTASPLKRWLFVCWPAPPPNMLLINRINIFPLQASMGNLYGYDCWLWLTMTGWHGLSETLLV